MRIEYYTRVSRRRMHNDYLEYVPIPKEVRGDISLYGKVVHVIIEVMEEKNETKHDGNPR